ncbi:MAG TPA: NAD(P)H-dependent oxidoreductase [Candidatus Saccharimonadales bacterium]|nr:NAD(P)H-dependent oxidoreductase [Candidatus Saccharimonadales bacterium]
MAAKSSSNLNKKIGIIIGSTRPQRIGPSIAKWVLGQASQRQDLKFEIIDLAEINLPMFDEPRVPAMGQYEHEHTKRWAAVVAGFDGFIFVTPEYNYGYPASLKNALDFIYKEWKGKPAAFVGYGAAAGGLRAVMQLKQLLFILKMVPVYVDVIIPRANSQVADGRFTPQEDQVKALDDLLDDLAARFA